LKSVSSSRLDDEVPVEGHDRPRRVATAELGLHGFVLLADLHETVGEVGDARLVGFVLVRERRR
jgi:hypothetical protein